MTNPIKTKNDVYLSSRGQHYADLDLAAGYTVERGPLYDKTAQHPSGLVYMGNAENVCFFSFPPTLVWLKKNPCTLQ